MERKKKSYNLIIGIIALLVIVLLLAIIGYFVSKPKKPLTQGEVESTEYRVSGKVTGRIDAIYVKEGMYVHKGDTLVHYDSPEVRAKMAQARGATDAASAQSRKAINGTRQEQIQGAYEQWQQAIVQEDVMKKSYDRIDKLHEEKVVSDQKYDEVKAKYDASVAQTKAAKSQYDMAVNGARREDKEAAEALVRQAQGAIAEVQAYESDLYLVAPIDGLVTKIYPHTGELVGAGAPVADISDQTDVWFTFNVREDNLSGMHLNDEITVQIPALSNKKVKAKVYFIDVQDSYATWSAVKETGMYDAKTFEVRARPEEDLEWVRAGMSVIVIKQK